MIREQENARDYSSVDVDTLKGREWVSTLGF